jgi:hypothetical protein
MSLAEAFLADEETLAIGSSPLRHGLGHVATARSFHVLFLLCRDPCCDLPGMLGGLLWFQTLRKMLPHECLHLQAVPATYAIRNL